MLKGLQALLASGLLLDPMVLLGIVTGSAFYFGLNSEQITAIYFDYRFYGLAAVVSVLYNFVWRPAYLRGGVSIDYQATSVNSVFSFLKVVISSLLVMSFISLISFGGDDGEGRVFAGRGIVEQADQKALKGVEARAAGGNAERKRHGEIAEADRNAVADAGEKVPAPHGALCCIHMRKILFSARHAVR